MRVLALLASAALIASPALAGPTPPPSPIGTFGGTLGVQGSATSPTLLWYGQSGESAPFSIATGGANFSCNAGTVFDPVLNIGFNETSDKTLIVGAAAGIGLSFEGNYCNAAISALEMNLDWRTTSNVFSGRGLAYGIDRINGAGSSGYEYWNFSIGDANASGFSVLNKTGTTTLFNVTPAGGGYFSGNILNFNGSTPIISTNANNTPIGFSTNNAVRLYIDNAKDGVKFGNSDQTLLYRNGSTQLRTNSQLVIDQSLMLGTTALTLTNGAVGLAKITASASAPGAAGGKLELVCGTNSGSAKLIAYAGTSTTPVTIVDNIGSGVTGC